MARTNSVPPPPEKPQLLRSRTTGIFHIENQMENNKPSIVFTNKFPSSTDLTTSEEGTPVPMVKQETIVAVSDVNAISTTDHKEQDHARLSTSLNKISRSLSHHSFRNLLSRSQLNLTKMYQKPKPKPESIKQPTPQVQQPVQLSPSYSPPVPIVPRRPVTTTTIELKPNDKLLDESLSASLKKALSIDYKLGKVPLPERVIDDRAIVAGPGGGSLDSDFDDYHSKGW
ncbi:uncharacterized protein SPAPADRAFT_59750 [Spathaspora passalidarum NRRL Y-27907]|uniref:Uncharacterized protein n=1 Tax=Spathaspora passalidarum (strain NRRL Y-27907 / 11-Y1) TaxID=619300 RepID=G3AI24_SPAPN|nr:uncharacterized protein SPAPADRAFT_59750 [Spathaspora passalidarum NRRL Y-27907]EGW34338.1 hypothetical protein SPAPADRAFT_59750 [Spathaspora passalidarum NRRL Y-27907]